jgi:hypothetical protein
MEMQEKSESASPAKQIEQARKLMAEGRTREALVLAMDALVQALDCLYDSLVSMQKALAPTPPAQSPQAEKPQRSSSGDSEGKKPFLH